MPPPAHNFPTHQSSEEAYNTQAVKTNNTYPLEHFIPQPTRAPKIGTESETILSICTPKVKRIRTTFTSDQIILLEREFERGMYLKRPRRFAIAQRLSLTEKNVKIWFQNRRIKQKQDVKKVKEPSAVTKPPTNIKQNVHNDIVQRLMSYSQDSVIRKTQDPVHKLSHRSDVIDPVPTSILNASLTPDPLSELLALLDESFPPDNKNSSSDSSHISASNLSMGEESIRKNLKLSEEPCLAYTHGKINQRCTATENKLLTQQECQQWTPNVPSATPMPSVNLTWGDPNIIN